MTQLDWVFVCDIDMWLIDQSSYNTCMLVTCVNLVWPVKNNAPAKCKGLRVKHNKVPVLIFSRNPEEDH